MNDAADFSSSRDYWSKRSKAWVTAASTGKATDETFDRALIDAAKIAAGTEVLDLAAGTGDPTMTIAAHLGDAGTVTALDMTLDMLAVARRRARNLALTNIRLVAGDMEALPFRDSAFDAITCRNGLMFPDNRVACAREARRVLKPGGRAAWLVWGTIEENPTYLTVNHGLERVFGEKIPLRMRRHALGDKGKLAALLGAAGFTAVEERRFAYERIVKKGDDYFRRAIARAVPNRIGDLTEAAWRVVVAAVEDASAPLRAGEDYRIPVVARIGIGMA